MNGTSLKNNLQDKLNSILKLAEDATPGPWVKALCVYEAMKLQSRDNDRMKSDAEFIAASRTLIPALVRALLEMQLQRNYFAKRIKDQEYLVAQGDDMVLAKLEGK